MCIALTSCSVSGDPEPVTAAPTTPEPKVVIVTETATPETTPPPTTTTPPPAPKEPASWTTVFKEAKAGVTYIETDYCEGESSRGSGALIADDLVLTAAHVVEGEPFELPSDITVRLNDQTTNAKIIGFNRNADLALLQTTTALNGYVFELAQDDPLPASEIAIMGYPVENDNDYSPEDLATPKFNNGTVSSLNEEISYASVNSIKNVLRTSLRAYGGNSGGPAINLDDQLVGILVAGDNIEMAEGKEVSAYAVQASRIKQALLSWESHPLQFPAQDCGRYFTEQTVIPSIDSTSDQASGIAQTFREHAEAINRGEFETAYSAFSPQMFDSSEDAASWSKGKSSSQWTNVVIVDVESARPDANLLQATVQFRTYQNKADGPQNLIDPRCADWQINYVMAWNEDAGRWLINSQKKSDESAKDCFDG